MLSMFRFVSFNFWDVLKIVFFFSLLLFFILSLCCFVVLLFEKERKQKKRTEAIRKKLIVINSKRRFSSPLHDVEIYDSIYLIFVFSSLLQTKETNKRKKHLSLSLSLNQFFTFQPKKQNQKNDVIIFRDLFLDFCFLNSFFFPFLLFCFVFFVFCLFCFFLFFFFFQILFLIFI